MSDFPKGEGIEETRIWLDKEGFKDAFVGWEADAILSQSKEEILSKVPGEKGEILYGLLKTARVQSGKL